MAIPVISEILSFLQSVMQSMPKAMRYIIFLFFLIVLVWMIPIFLHLLGWHCNHEKTLMTTNGFDFLGNIQLAFIDPKEVFNASEYTPFGNSLLLQADVAFFTRPYITGVREICIDYNTTNCLWGLLYTQSFFSNNPQCINCANYSCVSLAKNIGQGGEGSISGQCLCFSDAFRRPDSELSWFSEMVTCRGREVPPKNYAYNQSRNTFVCINQSVCGVGVTVVKFTIDYKLEQMGALPYTPTSEKDYTAAIQLSCNGDFQPQITVFKLPIFDLQIWLGLFVLGILFFFLNKIKRH